jgi:beta-glucosidase
LLLAQMTLAEKVDLMTGNQGEAPYAFYNAPIPRLGIPALKMADAGGGVAPRGWTLPGTGGKATAMPSEMAPRRHVVAGHRALVRRRGRR